MNEKKYVWERLDEVDSTNELAKRKRMEKSNCVFLAKRQNGGRGTKGRSFSSEEGGAYLSVLTHYEGYPARRAFELMAGAAIAVCRTLEAYGLRPIVKWPNDIFVNGKKICGILIENTLSGEEISSSIVGIGLNVRNSLPAELRDIATTVEEAGGRVASTEEVAKRLVEELQKPADMAAYRRYLGFVGRKVLLRVGERQIEAILRSVTDEGALQVEIAGGIQTFSSAEVERVGIDE